MFIFLSRMNSPNALSLNDTYFINYFHIHISVFSELKIVICNCQLHICLRATIKQIQHVQSPNSCSFLQTFSSLTLPCLSKCHFLAVVSQTPNPQWHHDLEPFQTNFTFRPFLNLNPFHLIYKNCLLTDLPTSTLDHVDYF